MGGKRQKVPRNSCMEARFQVTKYEGVPAVGTVKLCSLLTHTVGGWSCLACLEVTHCTPTGTQRLPWESGCSPQLREGLSTQKEVSRIKEAFICGHLTS